MAFYQALEISQVYISIPWVMASMGSALTAGYLEKRQVTKRLIPSIRCLAKARHAFTPALLRGPAAIGHPWPGAANPASCRVAHCARPAFSLWLTGQGRSKARSKAQRPRRPSSRPGLWLYAFPLWERASSGRRSDGGYLPADELIADVRKTLWELGLPAMAPYLSLNNRRMYTNPCGGCASSSRLASNKTPTSHQDAWPNAHHPFGFEPSTHPAQTARP